MVSYCCSILKSKEFSEVRHIVLVRSPPAWFMLSGDDIIANRRVCHQLMKDRSRAKRIESGVVRQEVPNVGVGMMVVKQVS